MTYKNDLRDSDSVNLGSNPSPPATASADVSGTSRARSDAEQPELTEHKRTIGGTRVGTSNSVAAPAHPSTSKDRAGDSGSDQGKQGGTADDRCSRGRHGPHPLCSPEAFAHECTERTFSTRMQNKVEEKMRWTVESREDRNLRKNDALRPQWKAECEWHSWFAWRPVNVTPTSKVWLQWVERRLCRANRDQEPIWYTWDLRRFEFRAALNSGDRRSRSKEDEVA